MDSVDDLSRRAVFAVEAIHSPTSSSSQREEAYTTCKLLLEHQAAFNVGVVLAGASANAAMVKHFGLQLVLAGLKRTWNSLSGVEKESTKTAVIKLLQDCSSEEAAKAMPSFLRWKLAEAICEIARQDWPEAWPGLALLLFEGGLANADGGVFSLFILSELADSVHEEAAAAIPPRRRRELVAAIESLAVSPTGGHMSLFGFIEEVLRRHGADRRVVHGVLSLLRALPAAVPVESLLAYRCDFVLRTAMGGGDSELRAAALLALAEWIPRLYAPAPAGSISAVKGPALPDLCRLLAFLTVFAGSCAFDRLQNNLGLHRQVVELLADLCEHGGPQLYEQLPKEELASLWRTLLHMARYPSMHIQHEALMGMLHLAKAHAPQKDVIPYAELFNVFFVLLLRLERFPSELPPSRSAWLLQCLGTAHVDAQALASLVDPTSSAVREQATTITNFGTWCAFVTETWLLEVAGDDQESRQRMFGNLKARLLETTKNLCRIAANNSDPSACAQYVALCRQTASFAQRARFEGDEVAFDAALGLVERIAPGLVQEAAESVRPPMLEASLALLQQSAGEQQPGTGSVEQRLMEFLAHMAPLYRHLPIEVSTGVLQRVLTVLRQPRANTSKELRQQAQNTLVAIGKSGALREGQIDAIAMECQSLGSHLSVPEQASVAESIVAAVVAAGVAPARQAAIAESFMQGPTDLWGKAGLAQRGSKGAAEWLSTRLSNAAASRQGQHAAALDELNDIRNLLIAFAGVTSRCSSAHARAAAGASSAGSPNGQAQVHGDAAVAASGTCVAAAPHPASRIVAAWAPGVRVLLDGLNVLTQSESGKLPQSSALAAALSGLADNEFQHIIGQQPGQEEVSAVPQEFDREAVRASRQRLWELRLASAKALQTCVLVPEFWSQAADALSFLRALAGSLPHQRPHVAQLLLSTVLFPLLQGPASLAALGNDICKELLPVVLSASIGTLEVNWSTLSNPPPQLSSFLERPLASATISLTRFVATFIGGLLGPGSPHHLASLEISRASVRPPPAPSKAAQRRKNRARNRFAALAADCDEEGISNVGDSGAIRGAQAKDHDAPRPSSHIAMIIEDASSRDALCTAIAALLQYPDVDVVRKALHSMGLLAAHLWNLAAGCCSNPGELLHKLACAVGPLPLRILRPMLHMVLKPPGMHVQLVREAAAASGGTSDAWASFISEQHRPGGKGVASELVAEVANTTVAVLRPMAKLLRLQCQQLGWEYGPDQIHRCAPLLESAQLLRRLPGITEAEVAAVLDSLLDEADDLDAGRVAVRAMLRKAVESRNIAGPEPTRAQEAGFSEDLEL